jgi:histone H3/H4
MADLTVKCKTKDQAGEFNVSEDFYEAFDAEAAKLLQEAKRRARENERKTLQPRDL